MTRIERNRERMARIEAAMFTRRSVPYARRCMKILDNFDAIEKGLQMRAFLDRVRAFPDMVKQMVEGGAR